MKITHRKIKKLFYCFYFIVLAGTKRKRPRDIRGETERGKRGFSTHGIEMALLRLFSVFRLDLFPLELLEAIEVFCFKVQIWREGIFFFSERTLGERDVSPVGFSVIFPLLF